MSSDEVHAAADQMLCYWPLVAQPGTLTAVPHVQMPHLAVEQQHHDMCLPLIMELRVFLCFVWVFFYVLCHTSLLK